MELHQGNILFINLNPAKGTETKKERPCMVVSNDEYNRHLNTVLVIPISSSDKYPTQERFVQSPFFQRIDLESVHGTALLQHVWAIDPEKRSNGEIVGQAPAGIIKTISGVLKEFF
ncbi:type II toxin-antitoxin system PemK/MazF family toxin [uncultured Lentilactobacillus sp.]|uniref:type II toxin-antitoxin system PemK/MazF family toxin n=1 Tax=uncultured Lentilactobacillus sp. TaxID=2805375 RepID=UPI0025951AA2|nr:type II toxin-antitoxin system PemK/MazF family toxin [uncultured Lentilactobacillus sp.]